MNPQADPLAALRDIHLPPDPGWWPPAPGWWLLALLVVGLLVLAAWLLPRPLTRHRQRRGLERGLGALALEGDANQRARALGEMSRLARRFAMTRFGRDRVAGLSGDKWLEFLDRTSGSRDFTRGPGRLLADGPYRAPADAVDSAALVAARQCLLRWARSARHDEAVAS